MSEQGMPPAATDDMRKTRGASSSRKVLQVLLSFSERRPKATVAELAAVIGAPVATTYRYVALLKELQILEEGSRGTYHVSSRVMPVARAAQIVNDLAHIAHPIMERASRELGETVMLFQRFGDAAVCIDAVECDRPMRFTFQPGHSLPLGIGASGKMLLSLLDAAERKRILARSDLRDRAGLINELASVQDNRWAESNSEIDEGVWACSVPVDLPRTAKRPTVLSAAGPAVRHNASEREQAIKLLRESSAAISSAVGEFAT
jgi:DNA-binding IclR family transcriptional regulator